MDQRADPQTQTSDRPHEREAHRERAYQPLNLAQQALVAVFFGLTVWYLRWRLTSFNPQAMALSVTVYAAESWFTLTVLLHLFSVWRLSVRRPQPPPEGRSVDVFVTTYNEPVSMVRRTLLGALAMDYPHRTWLLDDGDRKEMRLLAHALGCRYLARGTNTDAKAGNLNHALMFSAGEFVAVFDADHVPGRHFLTRTLGYFRDREVAFVQCPQTFYNLDAYQIRGARSLRWGEQSLFFRVIQRGKDYWNATMFVGTAAILRRRALQEIGGIATGTVAEDLHTTVRLQRAGWRSVYHDEPLAFGLAAPSLRSYLRQRVRWGQGAMQVWRQEGLVFRRGYTFPQRVCNLASVLTYFDAWPRLFLYALPAGVLITGVMPINAFNAVFLVHFLPFYLLHFWVFEEVARGYGNSVYVEEYNLLRSFAFAYSTLALLRGRIPFRVSDKVSVSRSSEAKMLLPHALELLWIVAGAGIGIWLWPTHRQLPPSAFAANLVWAALVLWIGVAALVHTLRRRQHRRDYRFLIPVPAGFVIDGELVFGVADNLSSHGMRIRVPPSQKLEPGTHVTGELYLPGATVPFVARVAHFDETEPGHFGLSAFWIGGRAPDALERFLYTSHLQWRVNALSEHVRPPIEWLAGLLARRPASLGGPGFHWSPLLSDSGPRPGVLGLVSATPDRRQELLVIAFAPLAEGESLRLWRVGPDRRELLVGSVAPAREYRELTQDGLHVYRLRWAAGLGTPVGAGLPEPGRTPLSLEAT